MAIIYLWLSSSVSEPFLGVLLNKQNIPAHQQRKFLFHVLRYKQAQVELDYQHCHIVELNNLLHYPGRYSTYSENFSNVNEIVHIF